MSPARKILTTVLWCLLVVGMVGLVARWASVRLCDRPTASALDGRP